MVKEPKPRLPAPPTSTTQGGGQTLPSYLEHRSKMGAGSGGIPGLSPPPGQQPVQQPAQPLSGQPVFSRAPEMPSDATTSGPSERPITPGTAGSISPRTGGGRRSPLQTRPLTNPRDMREATMRPVAQPPHSPPVSPPPVLPPPPAPPAQPPVTPATPPVTPPPVTQPPATPPSVLPPTQPPVTPPLTPPTAPPPGTPPVTPPPVVPPTGDPATAQSPFGDLGKLVEEAYRQPSRYDAEEAKKTYEFLKGDLERQRDLGLSDVDADAASRGVFFGSPAVSGRTNVRERFNRGLGELATNVSREQATTAAGDRSSAFGDAFSFLRDAREGEGMDLRIAELAGNLGNQGGLDLGSVLNSYGQMPTPEFGGGVDWTSLGALFGGGKPPAAGGAGTPLGNVDFGQLGKVLNRNRGK
jgi:hypothetical protein